MSLPHEPSAAPERAPDPEQRLADAVRRMSLEARHRMRIENLPDVTGDADARKRAVYISPRDTDMFGFTPEEVYQQGEVLWLGRIHQRDHVQVWGAHRALAEPEA